MEGSCQDENGKASLQREGGLNKERSEGSECEKKTMSRTIEVFEASNTL